MWTKPTIWLLILSVSKKNRQTSATCEYNRWVVETRLHKLRDTSDTLYYLLYPSGDGLTWLPRRKTVSGVSFLLSATVAKEAASGSRCILYVACRGSWVFLFYFIFAVDKINYRLEVCSLFLLKPLVCSQSVLPLYLFHRAPLNLPLLVKRPWGLHLTYRIHLWIWKLHRSRVRLSMLKGWRVPPGRLLSHAPLAHACLHPAWHSVHAPGMTQRASRKHLEGSVSRGTWIKRTSIE